MLGSHPGYPSMFICHVSSSSSWLWQFLRLSLCSVTLTVLRSTVRVYWRMPLYWYLSDVLVTIRLGLQVLERKTTEIKCRFPHIPSKVHTLHMTHRCDTALNIWKLGEYLSVSPPIKLPFSPLHAIPLRRMSLCTAHFKK